MLCFSYISVVFIIIMTSQDQYVSVQELEQIANESGSEMDVSDLDVEFVLEIDSDNSDLEVSGVVLNVQKEPRVHFMNLILLSGLTFLCVL